jgi:ABC-type ATPase involved in cell division
LAQRRPLPATKPASLLSLDGVSASYGRQPVLRDVTFSAEAGQLIFVTGRSGAGKTSLLRLINSEITPTSGTLWAAGLPLHAGGRVAARIRRQVGVVFQDYGLIRSMTALENVEFAYRISHFSETRWVARERALAMLADVGLSAHAGAFPAELSGGQQQRVAIARALVGTPDIVLADEPTGNLDRENSLAVLALLEAAAEKGALVIVVTYDPALLLVGHRRLHLDGGRLVSEGRIQVRAS